MFLGTHIFNTAPNELTCIDNKLFLKEKCILLGPCRHLVLSCIVIVLLTVLFTVDFYKTDHCRMHLFILTLVMENASLRISVQELCCNHPLSLHLPLTIHPVCIIDMESSMKDSQRTLVTVLLHVVSICYGFTKKKRKSLVQ